MYSNSTPADKAVEEKEEQSQQIFIFYHNGQTEKPKPLRTTFTRHSSGH